MNQSKVSNRPKTADTIFFCRLIASREEPDFSKLPLTKTEIEMGIAAGFPFAVLFLFPVDGVRLCFQKTTDVLASMGDVDLLTRHRVAFAVCSALTSVAVVSAPAERQVDTDTSDEERCDGRQPCYMYLKGMCDPATRCSGFHPTGREKEDILRRLSFMSCNYDKLCDSPSCVYYHSGLFPCTQNRGRATGGRVEFPLRAMPYNRDALSFFDIEDPVLKLKQVNARRGEVGAHWVVDLHFQKAVHVAYLLDRVMRNQHEPVAWEPERRGGSLYLWLSCGAGKSGRGLSGLLLERVREWLIAAGYLFREAEVNGAVGGFRVELPRVPV